MSTQSNYLLFVLTLYTVHWDTWREAFHRWLNSEAASSDSYYQWMIVLYSSWLLTLPPIHLRQQSFLTGKTINIESGQVNIIFIIQSLQLNGILLYIDQGLMAEGQTRCVWSGRSPSKQQWLCDALAGVGDPHNPLSWSHLDCTVQLPKYTVM